MPVPTHPCTELISNIHRTLHIPTPTPHPSPDTNLINILSQPSFIKAFCRLHGFRDASVYALLEIVSDYLDNKNIHKFYVNYRLNLNVVDDFNHVLVTFYTNLQVYNEQVERIIDSENRLYKYLIVFNKTIKKYKRCSELEALVKLHNRITTQLKRKKVHLVFMANMKKLQKVYYNYITNKALNTDYYTDVISNDPDTLNQLNILLSTSKNSASSPIEPSFMIPITHFLSYQSTFTKLQTKSYRHDKTLSFLADSFCHMTRTINSQMRTDDYEKIYTTARHKILGIEQLEKNSTGTIQLIIEKEFTFRRNCRRYMLIFFQNGFAIVSVGRKMHFMEYCSYIKVNKCKVYKEGGAFMVKLVFTLQIKEMIVVCVDSAEKTRRIVDLTKSNKNEGVIDRHAAKIEFADLKFLIQYKGNETLDVIKKKIIARVGRHFCADKNIKESKIDLALYQNFHFYTRHDGNLYLLDNDDDLRAAVMLTDYKLDIVIKNMEDSTDQSNGS